MARNYCEDEKVINAFLQNYRVVDIMEETKLSKNTIYKLKHDSDFQAVLKERRDMIVKAAVERMRSYLVRDVEELQKVIENPETSPQVKINAVQVMLSQLREWLSLSDIIERVEKLEEAHKNDFGTF